MSFEVISKIIVNLKEENNLLKDFVYSVENFTAIYEPEVAVKATKNAIKKLKKFTEAENEEKRQ